MSNTTTPRKPQPLTAYSVRDYEKNGEKKSEWTRIGVALAHRDGDGFDILLGAQPIDGRIVLRKAKPKPAQA
jgi:hypothetical protein